MLGALWTETLGCLHWSTGPMCRAWCTQRCENTTKISLNKEGKGGVHGKLGNGWRLKNHMENC